MAPKALYQAAGDSLSCLTYFSMNVSRLLPLARPCCLVPAVCGLRATPLWAQQSTFRALTVTHARRDRNRRSQEGEDNIDSTNELLLDRLEAGNKGDALDIDELLNDEAAMGALRSKLMAEMAAAHRSGAGASNSSSNSSVKPRPRNRAFDSDEYDSSALESVYEADSMDALAQQAANKLASESQEIAEHIMQEHKGDGMVDERQPNKRSKQSSSSNSSTSGGFRVKLPAFAGGDKGDPDMRSKQQQQGRNSRGKAPDGSSSNSSSRSSSQGQGSRRVIDDHRGPRQLSADSAIGRVAESKGGVPVVVLKKGKARLFELGSPMVRGQQPHGT